MAKFKPAGSKKSKIAPDSKRGLIPCSLIVVAGFALAIGLKAWLRGLRMEAAALVGAVAAQITLGILTILSGVQIDIAATHQAMAVLLLAAMLAAAHRLGEAPA